MLFLGAPPCPEEIEAVRLFVYVVSDENMRLDTVAPRLSEWVHEWEYCHPGSPNMETNGMCPWMNERL